MVRLPLLLNLFGLLAAVVPDVATGGLIDNPNVAICRNTVRTYAVAGAGGLSLANASMSSRYCPKTSLYPACVLTAGALGAAMGGWVGIVWGQGSAGCLDVIKRGAVVEPPAYPLSSP